MVIIELTDEDARLLRGILENYLGDTRAELANTDTPEYRDKLHAEEDAVTRMVDLLRVTAGST